MQWPEAELLKPVGWKERIASHSSSVIDLIRKQIVEKLADDEFEELVKEILTAENFSNTALTVTAGRAENGADIVMSVSAPFFDELNIVVQIKHHKGVDDDVKSIEQLRRGLPTTRPLRACW